MGTAHSVIVRSTTEKAWTQGMAAYGRPELIVFELSCDWARFRIPRHLILREVLEGAAAAVVVLENLKTNDLHINTPYGVFRLEEALCGMVELRLISPDRWGTDATES